MEKKKKEKNRHEVNEIEKDHMKRNERKVEVGEEENNLCNPEGSDLF